MASIASLILGSVIVIYSPLMLLLLTILISLLAFVHIDWYLKHTGTRDPSEVVIDELIGMWLAILILSEAFKDSINCRLSLFLLTFLLFRFFDIKKPSVIGRVDRGLKGAFGVILDDVLSGIFAAFGALLIFRILGLFFEFRF